MSTEAAHAQERWPAKPLHWIVPYAAGGFSGIRSETAKWTQVVQAAKIQSE